MKKNKIKWLTIVPMFLLISCNLEEPVLPTWIANWRIPFESSYTMNEVLQEENFRVDTTATGQQVLAIYVTDSTEERSVSKKDLATVPESDYAGETIDELSLGTIGPVSSNLITLADILGFQPVSGQTVDIVQSIVNLDLVYLLYIDVGWAEIKDGLFRIEFVNNTFLDIQGGLEIDIYNDSTDVLIGTVTLPDPIPAMSSGFAVPDMDLSGAMIHTRFLLQIRMPLAAMSHLIGDDDLNDGVWINGTLVDINVHEAEALFPPQYLEIADSSSIMEEEHRIRTAEVAGGSIELFIQNHLDVMSHVVVRLLNFRDISGDILTESFQLEPNSTSVQNFILQDYFIADYPDPNSGNYIDYIQYEVSVVTDSSGELSTLSEDDSITVSVTPDSIFFSRINGRVNQVEIEIDPVEKTDLEGLSRIDGKIFLDSLEMILDVFNGTGIPVTLTLNISGRDDDQEIVLAPRVILIQGNDTKSVRLSGKDPRPNIVDLVSILPNAIRFEATALVDGDGEIEIGQNVWARFQIHSPLFFRIAAESFLLSDISEETLDEDLRENIEKNLSNAKIFFDLFNGLPVGSSASVYVAIDSTDLFSETIPDSSGKFIISGIDVPAAEVGPNGYVIDPATNKVLIELTKQQLDIFAKNERLFVGTKTILDETNELVKIRLKDKISTHGYFQFDFKMNNESEEN